MNHPPTTEIYTLSLHDALPILAGRAAPARPAAGRRRRRPGRGGGPPPRRRSCQDRKSTRLNSSHTVISYAVFCLKKKSRIDEIFNMRRLLRFAPERIVICSVVV